MDSPNRHLTQTWLVCFWGCNLSPQKAEDKYTKTEYICLQINIQYKIIYNLTKHIFMSI